MGFNEFRKKSRLTKSAEVILDDLADDPNPTKWWLLGMKMNLGFALEKERDLQRLVS